MKKNQKGFTLVELLAVIVILAVIILIAVNAVLPQMRKARKNSFADEAINFAKAAETAYVDKSLTGTVQTCFNISELRGTYVSKADENYTGFVQLNINGDNITKTITITDGSNFYVAGVNPSSSSAVVNAIEDYSASAWANVTGGTACPTQTQSGSGNGNG